jgi:hypothetical protein
MPLGIHRELDEFKSNTDDTVFVSFLVVSHELQIIDNPRTL